MNQRNDDRHLVHDHHIVLLPAPEYQSTQNLADFSVVKIVSPDLLFQF